MNETKILFKSLFISIYIFLIIDVAIGYSETTGYNFYDMLAVMLIVPCLSYIYFTVTNKLYEKLYVEYKKVIINGRKQLVET